jgi:S-adenosyl methyltransferase
MSAMKPADRCFTAVWPDQGRPHAADGPSAAPVPTAVVGQVTAGGRPDAMAASADVSRHAGTSLTIRSRTDIAWLVDGVEQADSGLLSTPRWRPESPDGADDVARRASILASVGCKP